MAGDWIKLQTCTPDKPEVHLIAEQLQIEPDAVVGKLVRLWCWADQQTIDGNASSVTKSLLDRITCVTGFADSLLQVGWLEQIEGGFRFPNFDRHNGNSAKTRASSSKRVEKHRKTNGEQSAQQPQEVKRKCNAQTVTSALPEKRREEKSKSIYTPGDEIQIPERLNTPELVATVGRWMKHLEDADREFGTTKAILRNSPQEQELWIMLNGWKTDPETTSQAISTAITGRWQNLRPPERKSSGKGSKSRYSEDLMETLRVCKLYPGQGGWAEREKHLSPERIAALKKSGGSAALMQAAENDWQLQTFAQLFDANLKELKANGITASN